MDKVKPTPEQLDWAAREVGVIIHYDIQVFEQKFEFRKAWGYIPDVSVFNPQCLNTDQWIETACLAGAKYAILVAKHCTGFSLWDTKAHDYSSAKSPCSKDIVREFIASCNKYGVKPGLYYSLGTNAKYNVDAGYERSGDPDKQRAYNDTVVQQITELWSQYGDLYEIWFDGGIRSTADGGADIKGLYEQYQPHAVKFQGSTISEINNLRWAGNEEGYAAVDCYSTVTLDSQSDGTIEDKLLGRGSLDGARWAPAECDTPNRKKQWFYKDGQDNLVKSAKLLKKRYIQSVGRNSNLLLGMVIDRRGLVPDKDRAVFKEFGDAVKEIYARPTAHAVNNADRNEISVKGIAAPIRYIVIEECLKDGHTIDGFRVIGKRKGKEKTLFAARVIGNKRIIDLKRPRYYESVKLIVDKSVGDTADLIMTVYE